MRKLLLMVFRIVICSLCTTLYAASKTPGTDQQTNLLEGGGAEVDKRAKSAMAIDDCIHTNNI